MEDWDAQTVMITQACGTQRPSTSCISHSSLPPESGEMKNHRQCISISSYPRTLARSPQLRDLQVPVPQGPQVRGLVAKKAHVYQQTCETPHPNTSCISRSSLPPESGEMRNHRKCISKSSCPRTLARSHQLRGLQVPVPQGPQMRDLNYGRKGTETGCEAEGFSASKKQLKHLLAAAQG